MINIYVISMTINVIQPLHVIYIYQNYYMSNNYIQLHFLKKECIPYRYIVQA
jgi:hypothetical protein